VVLQLAGLQVIVLDSVRCEGPAEGAIRSAIRPSSTRSKSFTVTSTSPRSFPRGYIVELGKAAIRRAGTDITLVSYGQNVYHCLSAADELQKAGIQRRSIDIRTLVPLDEDTIITRSPRPTGLSWSTKRRMTCGFAGDHRKGFAKGVPVILDAPPSASRVWTRPVPWVKPLELHVLPSIEKDRNKQR